MLLFGIKTPVRRLLNRQLGGGHAVAAAVTTAAAARNNVGTTAQQQHGSQAKQSMIGQQFAKYKTAIAISQMDSSNVVKRNNISNCNCRLGCCVIA